MYREEKQHGANGFPFELYHNQCKNGLSLFTHYHREFEIIHILSGSGTAYVDDECYNISTGDILFIASERLHGIVKNSDTQGDYYAMVFAPEFLGVSDAVADKYIAPILNKTLQIPTLIRHTELADCISQLTDLSDGALFELKAKYVIFRIWEILISLSKPSKTNELPMNLSDIRTTIDYIKSNYSHKITLSQLADSANMSKEYFCRKFKDLTGVSPIHYLTQIRIENSCLLLKNTDSGIGDIAMDCGFSSFSYYSEIFKKYMACTPKAYRKEHSGKL